MSRKAIWEIHTIFQPLSTFTSVIAEPTPRINSFQTLQLKEIITVWQHWLNG